MFNMQKKRSRKTASCSLGLDIKGIIIAVVWCTSKTLHDVSSGSSLFLEVCFFKQIRKELSIYSTCFKKFDETLLIFFCEISVGNFLAFMFHKVKRFRRFSILILCKCSILLKTSWNAMKEKSISLF